ncbi:hypothetical protein N0V90_009896 [Kalmusia sp. IMI 367209]|nr:hypothetical protein N0V90_009896 [Kalmusia sp. IMI 367209]
MPPSLRRRAQAHAPSPTQEVLSESSDDAFAEADLSADEEEEEELQSDEEEAVAHLSPGSGADDVDEDDDEDAPLSPSHASASLPPNLREISTLASWTVSSSKPGCSIPQLRHPSPNLFWQSDGPQPHYLNIHFFKLVRIVGLRLYLDFEQDESYTPTRIVLLAGSGMNDLVEWGEMRLESPRGWVWADFSGVGDPDDEDEESDVEGGNGRPSLNAAGAGAGPSLRGTTQDPMRDDASDFENTAPRMPPPTAPTATPSPPMNPRCQTPSSRPSSSSSSSSSSRLPSASGRKRLPAFRVLSPAIPSPLSPLTHRPCTLHLPRKAKTPVLRCHLVQIKILENHQNGKDTHLRGLQIFARDNEKDETSRTVHTVREPGAGKKGSDREARREVKGFAKSEWMAEPVIR